jgi:hypothetical protein
MTSNHDSCWRSDGLRDIFKCYMVVREDMDNKVPNYDFKENEVSIGPPTFGKFITFVDLVVEKGDDNDYQLKSIEETP